MQSYAVISFINFVIALTLGSILILYKSRNPSHRRLAYVNFAVALWAFGYWQWQMATNYTDAMLWTRILTIGSIALPSTFVFWVATYLKEINRYKSFLRLVGLSTISFIILTVTPYMVHTVEPALGFPYWPKPGSAYTIFLFFHFIGFMGFGFIRLLFNTQSAASLQRQRLRIVISGMLFGFICGLTNFPLWYGIPFPPIGNFLIMVYPLSLSYSMLRYRFMDTRIAFEETFSRVVKSILLLLLFLVLAIVYSWYFNEPVHIVGYTLTASLAAVIVTMVSEAIDRASHRFIDTYIFKRPPLAKEFRNLQIALTQSLHVNDLYESLNIKLCPMLGVSKISLLLPKTEDLAERALGLTSNPDQQKSAIQLLNLLSADSSIYILDELVEELNEETIGSDHRINYLTEVSTLMEELDCAVCLPIPRKDISNGLLLIGRKQNGGAYSVQEVDMLDTLRLHLSNALENVLLYERELRFNEELQIRVAEATQELQGAYDKLKAVDKMKDYIIDISSHELRTPASIIKSYLWLVIEGKKGPINDKQLEALNRAFQSNERLLQIINDMLDVSRIEEGRLQINHENFDLLESTRTILEELTIKASEKGLELKLTNPNDQTLTIYGDKEKTEEIIVNLTSNAIKYTNEGYVTITINEDATSVIISVKDTGVGIREEDMPKLFSKFFRTEQTLVQVPTAGGTGLGLFITKSLIKSLNGSITVESETNKGTTFTVTLPKYASK